MNQETKEEQIARWEKEGWILPDCAGCKEFYTHPAGPISTFAPRHKASERCESGKRAHCTCAVCF